MARLAAQGKVRIRLTLTSKTGPDMLSYNVVADLKGSEHSEQVVIVSGHLDSWDLGTGAIDDAAGVAVAMETAELVQRLHLYPKRTIRVIAWMDEENGGRGHEAYAKAHEAEIPNYGQRSRAIWEHRTRWVSRRTSTPSFATVKAGARHFAVLWSERDRDDRTQPGCRHCAARQSRRSYTRHPARCANLLQLSPHCR